MVSDLTYFSPLQVIESKPTWMLEKPKKKIRACLIELLVTFRLDFGFFKNQISPISHKSKSSSFSPPAGPDACNQGLKIQSSAVPVATCPLTVAGLGSFHSRQQAGWWLLQRLPHPVRQSRSPPAGPPPPGAGTETE